MTALLTWGVRRLRPMAGWMPFFLVMGATLLAAAGLRDARWVKDDQLFVYVALAGTLVSAVLANSRASGPLSALFLVVVGLVYVTNGLSHFMAPLWGGIGEVWRGIVWLWLRLWQPDNAFAPPAFVLLGESRARLAVLGERLSSWGVALFGGSPELNRFAFLFVSGLLFWACTAWATWSITRKGRPMLAMLPLGTVLGMSTYLGGAHIGYLFGFTACALMLFPIVRLSWQERRWDREEVDYSPEIRFDMWQMAVLVTVMAVVLGAVLPVLHIPRLARAIWDVIRDPQEAVEEALTRFFGGVEPDAPPEIPVSIGGSGGGAADASLPRAHLLGGNPDLSNQVVMKVCIDAPPPIQEGPYEFEPVGPRYYWRGITYERFDGRRWFNSGGSIVEVPAYDPVVALTVTATKSLKQRYLIYVPHGETLYAVGEPQFVDQRVRSKRRAADDLIGLEGEINDYVAISQVPNASAGQLLLAGEDDGQRIADAYLDLPKGLPDRVRFLAEEIVQDAGATSAYEKAAAIEGYLRQFPYDLEVSAPPPGWNAVDYFLFDVQRGYCDYYASAFVVLARLAGVPARLAVGYAMGSFNLNDGCYWVVERDGHSWPEVYFPGYGWVPFEPTAAFRRFERPEEEVRPGSSLGLPDLPKRPWHIVLREWWRRAKDDWTTYVAIAAGIVLLPLMVVRWRYWRWREGLSAGETVILCYEEMGHMGDRLGTTRHPQDTPTEYCERLVAALSARVTRWPWSDKKRPEEIPLIRRSAFAIGAAYQQASYSAHPVNEAMRTQVERHWEYLRRQMQQLRVTTRDVQKRRELSLAHEKRLVPERVPSP